jgi:hypothetical protein
MFYKVQHRRLGKLNVVYEGRSEILKDVHEQQ